MTKKYPEALIFDMDGTLIDNMDYHRKAFYLFLEKYNIYPTEEEYTQKNKGTITEIIPRFFGNKLSREQIEALGEEKEALYREIYRPHLKPIPGLLEFLGRIAQKGIPTALATAGDRTNVQFVLDALQLNHYFDVLVTGEDVNHGKPNPEVFLLAADRLAILPENCLVFEDSFPGIEAGKRAGMQVVGIISTHTYQELQPLELYQIVNQYGHVKI